MPPSQTRRSTDQPLAPLPTRPLAALPAVIPALLLAALPLVGTPAGASDTARPTSALATGACEPAGELRGDADSGANLHVRHCATCHGPDGSGEVAIRNDVPPRDQSDPDYMSTLSDEFLYTAICKGGEAVGMHYIMPAWGDVFSDDDIRNLIAYIRSFSGT